MEYFTSADSHVIIQPNLENPMKSEVVLVKFEIFYRLLSYLLGMKQGQEIIKDIKLWNVIRGHEIIRLAADPMFQILIQKNYYNPILISPNQKYTTITIYLHSSWEFIHAKENQ